MKVAAIVLCAGLSRRMGKQDKLLMDFAGSPLFSYVLDLVAAADFSMRIVVANREEIGTYARQNGFVVVKNPLAADGMATSICAGISGIKKQKKSDNIDGIMFFNADQPFLCRKVVQKLLAVFAQTLAAGKPHIIVPVYEDTPASPCIFPWHFLPELLRLRDDHGGRMVYRQHWNETVIISCGKKQDFIDIDTIEDIENFLVLAQTKNIEI